MMCNWPLTCHSYCRKAKANLLETCVPKLEKLARRGKNLSKEAVEDRAQKVGQDNPADLKELHCS